MLISSSSSLYELIHNRQLSIIKKIQKTNDAYNYYFNPSISIEIFKPKVIICNQNYMVFEFNKYENLGLYKMLESINEQLYNFLKNFYPIQTEMCYKIFSDIEGDKFTIRCHLPKVGRKYLITSKFSNNDVPFILPKVNCIFDSITIDIKNIWEQNNRVGFNLELKGTRN